MQLTELKITEFVDLLASNEPAPGGGSAAALTASLGVALTSMVGNLTVGKQKYAEYEVLMTEVLAEATELKAQLVESVDKDTAAFNGVAAVFAMPKETAADKDARSAAMQKALINATLVPFAVMELCLKALLLTEKAVGKSNINAASDLGVAALNLNAGIKGAWLNVLINLSGIKDESFVAEYKTKGQELLAKADKVAGQIYEDILASI